MEIVLATWNPRKIKKLMEGLMELPIQPKALFLDEVNEFDETGLTFEENGLLKASAVQLTSNRIVVAEDSGLCVSVLDGDPGVRTARWAPEKLKHAFNPPLRDARFMSVIVIRFPDGSSSVTYGKLEGRIALSPYGELGSDYSRIFEMPSSLTIAENGLPTMEINDHHRQALAKATECIREWLIAQEARGVSID
ncbi:non-canonical purine NTP pyrophosphatase [Paenibacillus taichungensis]|uniref:non-canonical purine NTP pyrophosphatase n=1 Tax=Paenibacillus taichungensis TaxID=484184 RepID=UPI0038D0D5F1